MFLTLFLRVASNDGGDKGARAGSGTDTFGLGRRPGKGAALRGPPREIAAPPAGTTGAAAALMRKIGRSEVRLLVVEGDRPGTYIHKFVDKRTGCVVDQWLVKSWPTHKLQPSATVRRRFASRAN